VSAEPSPHPAPRYPWLSAVAPAVALVLLAAIFFRASNAPVWHLDPWAHWKFGQWICEHGRLPERDPFSPYSDHSHPLVDVWDLPPSASIYWYSHWDHFTPQHMGDGARLLALSAAPPSWRSMLERYRINTLALEGDDAARSLRDYVLSPQGSAEWEVIYRDDSGLVAVRRIDPFVVNLAGAQVVQGCVGAGGAPPLAGPLGFLADLSWFWPER
jgi:hypothetical protein